MDTMPSKAIFAKTVQFYIFMGAVTSADINQNTNFINMPAHVLETNIVVSVDVV